jgi:hypothetical protein
VTRSQRARPKSLSKCGFHPRSRLITNKDFRWRSAGLRERAEQVDRDALGGPADIAAVVFLGPYSGGASIPRRWT